MYFKSHSRFGIALVGIVLAVAFIAAAASLLRTGTQESNLRAVGAASGDPSMRSEVHEPAPIPEKSDGVPANPQGSTDSGEATPDAIPGAVRIPMLNGPELVAIPLDPNKSRADQTEWMYISSYRIVEARYDRENRLLVGRVDARLSAQTEERVVARLREITGAPAQSAIRLNPVRLQSLIIELCLPDKKLAIRSEAAGHDIANGPIPFLYRVKENDELDQLLRTNMRDLSLAIRSMHPYSSFIRNTMQVELSMTAAREALEKVLPKGMKLEELERHPLVVDRDTLLQLQQVLREEFRIRTQGDPSKLAGLDRVLEKVLDRVMVSNLPLHEVSREIIDNFVIWDSKTARLDISPNERATLTNELEEANEKRSAFKHAWDTMREEAKKTNDYKSWHKTLLDKMKLDAKLSIGIGIFGGSASLNLEKEHNESDQGADQALRENFEKMKNAGEMTQENFEKSYRKFKGEDWARSAAGKILNLRRVTNLNVGSFRSAILEHVQRLSKGMLERVTLLPLEPRNDSPEADTLSELAMLKDRVAREVKEKESRQQEADVKTVARHQQIEKLQAKRAALEKALDAELAKFEKARCSLKNSVATIDAERRKGHDSHVAAEEQKWHAGRNQGMVEWMIHLNKIGGQAIPPNYDNRAATSEKHNSAADAAIGAAAQANKAIDVSVKQAASADEEITACQKEIIRLRGELAQIVKELVTVIEQ